MVELDEIRAGAPRGGTSACPDTALRQIVWLDEPQAADPALTGAKAAALAHAAARELPVLPGFVLTTDAVDRLPPDGALPRDLPAEVTAAWRRLSDDGQRSLVVRSSSTVEDLGASSMAGRFASVVDVRGPDRFRAAVARVVASRAAAARDTDALRGDEPLAVLVQPLLDAVQGGVLFGIDPVSGREDQLVVAAVNGGPDRLVSGEVDGSRYVLTRDGRRREYAGGEQGGRLPARTLRKLAALAERTEQVFGGPQDVEWAVDRQGRLWLLQSRPVTAERRGVPRGVVLGPGPVAETFPEPLHPLEVDLWVPPLRRALAHAVGLAGTASPATLHASPLVEVVGGRVALDLELLEPAAFRPTVAQRLDPRPRLRRLRASWRVGRLRAALPTLARAVVDDADAALSAVPELADLDDAQLVGVLHRCEPALASVHAHELLVGLLVDPGTAAVTGTGTALRVLAAGRAAGRSDAELLAEAPVLLALTPPQIGPGAALPADVTAVPSPAADRPAAHDDDPAVLREALRLRVRWLHELTAQAAWELGRRWTAQGRLPDAASVAGLSLRDVAAAALDPHLSLRPRLAEPGDPLPSRFRLSDTGLAVPLAATPGSAGTGAGGGSGIGRVHQGANPPLGSVLVVGSLDPSLAPVLPRLSGLVAETGSVLAHLAILAREAGVPTVVGLAGAREQLPPGTVVRVDGVTGQVDIEDDGSSTSTSISRTGSTTDSTTSGQADREELS